MDNITMKEVLEQGKSFFKTEEVKRGFYTTLLKYETRPYIFTKIISNEDIKKYDTTINSIYNFFFEEEREIHKKLKQDNRYRMAYKINHILNVYILNFMEVFNYEDGTFEVSFTEYLPFKEMDGLHNACGYKDDLEKKYPNFTFKLQNNYDTKDNYSNKMCEIVLNIKGNYEEIKEVIAKSGYKKVTVDNFRKVLDEYVEFIQKDTKFKDYQIIPTQFKEIDDLF